jgi:peptidoglycan/LPS O-acetylase OafA/YrhL
MSGFQTAMRYRPEIDGLRAFAVLPVIFFHAGVAGFEGGFVGVDIFFVISGFLITSILVSELETGKFSIVSFYERRARRILPALFFMMLLCLPMAWLFLLPADLEDFSRSMVAVVAFVSNIFFWWTSDYFAAAAELKPLLHTWSLAVEEQYYLFYPVLLLSLWRCGRRSVFWVLAVASVASLVTAQIGIATKPVAAFYLLPTRAWELLLGSLVVFVVPKIDALLNNQVVAEIAAALGLMLISYAILWFDKSTPFPGAWALVPTVGTVLILAFARPATRVGRLLGWGPFVKMGLISYSAYLWHQPLIAFVRHEAVSAPGPGLLAAVIATSLVLAHVSWRYVESPFRARGVFSRRQIFVFSAVGLLFFGGVGVVGAVNKGFADRLPAASRGADADMARSDSGWCFYSIDANAALKVGSAGTTCWLGERAAHTKALLVGDSFAGQYEPLWDVVGRRSGFAVNSITTNWCFPALGDEFIGPKTSIAYRQCQFNRAFVGSEIGRYDFVVVAGHWMKVANLDQLKATMEFIDWLSARVRFVVVMPSPRLYDADIAAYYKKSHIRGSAFDPRKVGVERDRQAEAANRALSARVAGRGNVLMLDRADLFSIDGHVSDVTEAGVPFSLEGTHISVAGAQAAAAGFMRSGAYVRFEQLLRGDALPR